jgi:hypothetical protein
VGRVELLVQAILLWAPPAGEVAEGPEEADVGAPDDADAAAPDDADVAAPDDADVAVPDDAATSRDVDAIVEAAAQAAKDRAWLERNNQDIQAYVQHLDALADVSAELDTCDAAIRAELRMALALAYLKAAGDCAEDGDTVDAPDEAAPAVEPVGELPLPVLECFEVLGPRECADRLLEHVAEFAEQGPAGTDAPFSQAFGCPHAVAEMSVEQMFGTCMVAEYDQAVTRFTGRAPVDDQPKDVQVWPVPRWASIAGISGGAAMVIAGAVLLGIDGKCPGGHDPVTEVDQCPSVYNTNVGGGVLVGVGAVVMVGMGTVLTITEIQRSKQGKQRPSALRRRIDRAEALTGLRLSLPRPQLARHR